MQTELEKTLRSALETFCRFPDASTSVEDLATLLAKEAVRAECEREVLFGRVSQIKHALDGASRAHFVGDRREMRERLGEAYKAAHEQDARDYGR